MKHLMVRKNHIGRNLIIPLMQIAVILSLLIVFHACTESPLVRSVPIGKIHENPRSYEGAIITIKGEVVESISLLVVKYFTLRDDTGQIIIVTERILPKAGDVISVRGHIEEAFSIGDKRMTILREEVKNN